MSFLEIGPMARIEIFENLPIGGKIWLGFSLTTALFIVVTWLYHGTLFQALSDYEQLLSVSEARKSHLQHIYQYVLEARRNEKDFLAQKRTWFAEQVDERADRVLAETAELEKIEEISGDQRVAANIRELTEEYRNAFSEVVSAWRTKGLDHESGLQGRFRRTIHAVEDKARNFKAGTLYLTLLQIRRSEKDTGLRRSQEYVDRTHDLIRRFIALVEESDMEETIKSDLTRINFTTLTLQRDNLCDLLIRLLQAIIRYVSVRQTGCIELGCWQGNAGRRKRDLGFEFVQSPVI